ncbi:hypothetical protein [Halococcus salsus]|uniref:hypothetical protein n=1 Tax=Halococcus salsus TaxID=2162894 RepID=UPI001356D79D|nr:hypothetical protein [Halococcus salsus]
MFGNDSTGDSGVTTEKRTVWPIDRSTQDTEDAVVGGSLIYAVVVSTSPSVVVLALSVAALVGGSLDVRCVVLAVAPFVVRG